MIAKLQGMLATGHGIHEIHNADLRRIIKALERGEVVREAAQSVINQAGSQASRSILKRALALTKTREPQ